MKSFVAAATAGLLLYSTAYASDTGDNRGAFGFRKGMTLAEIRTLGPVEQKDRGVYVMKAAPNPHPAFFAYLMFVSRTAGLCKVVGIGKPVEAEGDGMRLMVDFVIIHLALEEKYGTPRVRDFLKPGSKWTKPGDWMMGLVVKDRVLEATWREDEGAHPPPGIANIELQAYASSPSKGVVLLAYEFENYESFANERTPGDPTDAL